MKSNLVFDSKNLPLSKSEYIRALFISSFSKVPLEIHGESFADDVQLTAAALEAFKSGKAVFQCGHSAALLRFLFFRSSRARGRFQLMGSPSLLARNHSELLRLAKILGFQAEILRDHILIESQGWRQPSNPVEIDLKNSSQFYSGLLLSSWDLDFDFELKKSELQVSTDYALLTTKMLEQVGWRYEESNNFIKIPSHQQPNTESKIFIESDLSCAFAMAALAAASGKTLIENFPLHSFQADRRFVDVLKLMGVKLEFSDNKLSVESDRLHSIDFNLSDSPDLFPVLAALCVGAGGPSRLWGAQHLKWKESDRIAKMYELISSFGVKLNLIEDGLEIFPKKLNDELRLNKSFDCENDHRLAMAAAVLWHLGYKCPIANSSCVTKSFPDFWDRAQVPKEYLL
jgi:3-phosphoshikimate 1-carboxyvinyltransferase